MGDCRWNNQWVLLVLCGIAAAYWLIQLNVHQPTLREQPETSTLEGITGTPASRTTGVGTYAVSYRPL